MAVESTAATPATPTPGAAPPAAPATATPAPAAPDGAPPPAGDTPPPAAKPEDAPPPPKEEDDAAKDPRFAARFAALTKRERSIQEREKALKAREGDADYIAFKKARENAKLDPIGLLKAHGWDYDAVTQFVLGDNKLTPEQQIARLQEQMELDKKAREDAEAAKARDADAAVLDGHKRAIAEHVKANTERYELVSLQEDGAELVLSVIEQHWEATGGNDGGQILSIDEAAAAVEDYLEKQAQERVLKAKKFQPKTAPVTTPAATAPTTPPTTTPPPTLTNRSVTGATPVDAIDPNTLSDEESKRRAASLLRWTK